MIIIHNNNSGLPWPEPSEKRDSARRAQAHSAPMRKEGAESGCATPRAGAGRGSVSLAQSRAVALFLLELHSLTSPSPGWGKSPRCHLPDCSAQAAQGSLPDFLTFPTSLCSWPRGFCLYLLSQNLVGIWGGGRGREGLSVSSRTSWCWFSSALPHIPAAVRNPSSAGPPWQPWRWWRVECFIPLPGPC